MCNTEKIIENVREQPILYDLSHSEYKNTKKKDKIWDEIAMSVGEMTGDELKKKWKNLRDSYAKFLRTEKTKSGQEMKNLDRYKTWPWAQQMEFLRKSLSFAKTHTNKNILPVSQSAESSQLREDTNHDQLNNHEPVEQVTVAENIPAIMGDTEENQLKKRQVYCEVKQPEKKKKTMVNSQGSAVEQVICCLHQNRENLAADDIDDIFKGYAKTVKKFSKKRQAIVKFKMSQLIMENELAQLEEEEQHALNANTSTSLTLA
ncbi:uncharacterized protein LOC115879532 [Sitophilus oryzae]|uniref:Uncharacterized protein LOC115879532 n=1 Tax=Sitophilus oryzae TaxID=7048 RepID=A0A6J2XMJ5_SITOR|nr:uncharacterized protein LOC115879532 [Sitophilus oryzae]